MFLFFALLSSILVMVSHANDMDGEVFLFPVQSINNYVVLEPNSPALAKQDVTNTLESITVCLRTFTELTRSHSLFSVSSPKKDNNFLIFYWNRMETPYAIFVDGQEMRFRSVSIRPERRHICATWESQRGLVQLWMDGKPLARKVMKQGKTIQGPLKIILGQEQDSYGGSFEVGQSFVGEIDHVNVWDHVLSPSDIQQVMNKNKHFHGNIISWQDMRYEINGEVLVVPSQENFCDREARTGDCYAK